MDQMREDNLERLLLEADSCCIKLLKRVLSVEKRELRNLVVHYCLYPRLSSPDRYMDEFKRHITQIRTLRHNISQVRASHNRHYRQLFPKETKEGA